VVLAAEPANAQPSWPDYLAGRLRHDPVYVTDHESRLLDPVPAEAAIKRAIGALGEPAYVAVTLPLGLDDRDSDTLIPLLHDRLRTNAVYIVTTPNGSGGAVDYGGNLQVADAWDAADVELSAQESRNPNFRMTALMVVQRFVEIVKSGQVRQRLQAAERSADQERAAERKHDSGGGEAVPVEAVTGAALTGLPLLALLVRRRVRRWRR